MDDGVRGEIRQVGGHSGDDSRLDPTDSFPATSDPLSGDAGSSRRSAGSATGTRSGKRRKAKSRRKTTRRTSAAKTTVNIQQRAKEGGVKTPPPPAAQASELPPESTPADKAAGILQVAQAMAVGALGDEAAFTPNEAFLLQTSLAELMQGDSAGILDKLKPYMMPAMFVFGSVLYANRLAGIAIAKRNEKLAEQEAIAQQEAAEMDAVQASDNPPPVSSNGVPRKEINWSNRETVRHLSPR